MNATETEATTAHIRAARSKFLAMAGTYAMGVFNDNFFKQAAILLAVGLKRPDLYTLAAVLFTLPFIVLAAQAGYLADRFPKRNVVIAAKVLELAAMVCGAAGMVLLNWPLILLMVFIMGLQAAIFSPALNGSIPELYPASYVLKANSFMKMITTIFILAGIILAGPALNPQTEWHGAALGRWLVAGLVLLVALLGLVASLGVPSRPAANPAARFPRKGPADTFRDLLDLRQDRALAGVVLLDAFVWLVATMQSMLINEIGINQFGLSYAQTSYLLAPELLGVAVGGLLVGRLSDSKWQRVLAPAACMMGAAMLAVAIVPLLPAASDQSLVGGISWRMTLLGVLLLATGLAGGVLLVPLESFIQSRPPADRKGKVIAAGNFAAFTGILLGGVAVGGLSSKPLAKLLLPTTDFGIVGVVTLLAGLVVYALLRRRP